MKDILLSIRPQWVAKILNGEKTIEVRKGTTLYNAINRLIDGQGKASCLIYCTKENRYDELLVYNKDQKIAVLNKSRAFYLDDIKRFPYLQKLNGKVVAQFEAKAERIIVRKIWGEYEAYGEHINFTELSGKSCLNQRQIIDYVGESRNGTAIHIDHLVPFDRPKELKEFGVKRSPQSWQFIEVDE